MPLVSPPRTKDPRRVAAGHKTARKRWGEDGRIVRLDSLDPVTREVVVAILRARKNAEAAAEANEKLAKARQALAAAGME